MLKICGDTISKHLQLIFKQAVTTGTYLFDWKMGNIVPVHKKGVKQNIKNYRLVSLLTICLVFSFKITLLHKSNADLNLVTLV